MRYPRDVKRKDPSSGCPGWSDQRGLEGIEVALVSGLVLVSLLVGVPLAANGFQTVMTALAATLTTAGAGIN